MLSVIENGRMIPSRLKARDCPFCENCASDRGRSAESQTLGTASAEIMVTLTQFKRHVATHQEQIAIFAVPNAVNDDEGDELGAVAPDPDTADQGTSRRPELACPFKAHDSTETVECAGFSDWKSLREHLVMRKHKPTPHCPTCGMLFHGPTGAEERDTHIQAANCEPSISSASSQAVVTGDQERQIRQLQTRGMEPERANVHRWYEIWDILFPGEERPASPFLSEPPSFQGISDRKLAPVQEETNRQALRE